MRLLVDSHVALWWLEGNVSLGAKCLGLLVEADEVFFSAVTPWELGIKHALGKIVIPDGMGEALIASGFTALPVAVSHAEHAPRLPMHHRDPFDRMLVAQAQLEALVLVSADRALEAYDVRLLDAGR